MSYYTIPYQAPMSGVGAVVAGPVPEVEPNTGPWTGPTTIAERKYRARVYPSPRVTCDYTKAGHPVLDCESLYCTQMGLPQGAEYDRGDFRNWLYDCKCPHVRPAWCPPLVPLRSGGFRAAASGCGQPPGGAPDASSHCGSMSAMQQMLLDLGYYTGNVDGKYGPLTEGAMAAFKQAEGLPFAYLTDADCARLIERWNARAGGVSPLPLPDSGMAARLRPQMALRVRRPPVQDTRTAPPNGAATAMVGPGVLDKANAWWGAQSTPVKAGVVVGGVAVLGGTAYMLAR